MVQVSYEFAGDVPDDVKSRLPKKLPGWLLAGAGANTIRVVTPFGSTERTRHVVILAAHYVNEYETAVVVSMGGEKKEESDGRE